MSAGAVRAIELDINPYAVAGYLYVHHATGPVPVPVVPGQQGIPANCSHRTAATFSPSSLTDGP